jgi:hypothetical protein
VERDPWVPEVSLFSLAVLIIVVLSAFYGAQTLAYVALAYGLPKQYGLLYWLAGLVVGAAVPIGLGYLVHAGADLWYRYSPLRPTCRTGRCTAKDYRYLRGEPADTFECRCGIRYRKIGNAFVEVLPDGSTRPYMRQSRGRGRWIVDTLQEGH